MTLNSTHTSLFTILARHNKTLSILYTVGLGVWRFPINYLKSQHRHLGCKAYIPNFDIDGERIPGQRQIYNLDLSRYS